PSCGRVARSRSRRDRLPVQRRHHAPCAHLRTRAPGGYRECVAARAQLFDDAVERDAAIGETDWAAPIPGATRSLFPSPSGALAFLPLGVPRHPRVVLVPGATGSKEDFALMLPLLAGAGYFVQAYDLAGNYESADAGPPPGGRYDYALFVDDLIAVL